MQYKIFKYKIFTKIHQSNNLMVKKSYKITFRDLKIQLKKQMKHF